MVQKKKKTKHRNRPPINSSTFNIREIAKQLILLEEHLTDDEKFCMDCIYKHLLTVEALGEEALTLDPEGDHVDICKDMSDRARKWISQLADRKVRKESLAKVIRPIRKDLVSIYFDSRL
jgi:hypothetical protein